MLSYDNITSHIEELLVDSALTNKNSIIGSWEVDFILRELNLRTSGVIELVYH